MTQPAKYQEGAVPRPVGNGSGRLAGDQRVRAGGRVPEDQDAGPDQVLPRVAVQRVFRLLLRRDVAFGDEVFLPVAGAPADSGLRHAVVKSEMLVPGQVVTNIALFRITDLKARLLDLG